MKAGDKTGVLAAAVGGLVLGYVGTQVLGGKGISAELEAQAKRIRVYDLLSEVWLTLKPLYGYTDVYLGAPVQCSAWAFVNNTPPNEDNPQVVMVVGLWPIGIGFEFGSLGPPCDVYVDEETVPRFRTPPSYTIVG